MLSLRGGILIFSFWPRGAPIVSAKRLFKTWPCTRSLQEEAISSLPQNYCKAPSWCRDTWFPSHRFQN